MSEIMFDIIHEAVGEEYMVIVMEDGEIYEPSTYFTDDLEDAIMTLNAMRKELQ